MEKINETERDANTRLSSISFYPIPEQECDKHTFYFEIIAWDDELPKQRISSGFCHQEGLMQAKDYKEAKKLIIKIFVKEEHLSFGQLKMKKLR